MCSFFKYSNKCLILSITGFIVCIIGICLTVSIITYFNKNNNNNNSHSLSNSSQSLGFTDGHCKTINNSTGICKNITDCPVFEACISVEGCDGDLADYMMESLCEKNGSTPQLFCCPTTITTIFSSNLKNIRDAELLPVPVEECGVEADLPDRIYNGEKTQIGEFPWMALIKYSKNQNNNNEKNRTMFKCGGSLINRRYILTAAHCVAGNVLKKYRPQSIRLGEYDLSSEIDCQENNKLCADPPIDIEIEEIIVHEKFNAFTTISDFDIALIRLKESVNNTKFIKPICLPPHNLDDNHNNADDYILPDHNSYLNKLFVTGWGLTENRTFSDIKLKTSITLIDRSRCRTFYENQICGSGESDSDACAGDSGGPLMAIKILPNFQQYWYIIGIVSLGPKCGGLTNQPGGYTEAEMYLKWIHDNLKP